MNKFKIRTRNSDSHEIMVLWEDFMKNGFNPCLGKVYWIYSNYESDKDWFYDLEIIQEKAEWFSLPMLTYKKFDNVWEFPSWIYNTWQGIWSDSTLDRAYELDYEEYDMEKKEASVYISVK